MVPFGLRALGEAKRVLRSERNIKRSTIKQEKRENRDNIIKIIKTK